MDVPTQQRNVKKIQDKDKPCADGDLYREWIECPPWFFKCRYADHIISKYLKPPKNNNKQQKNFSLNERDNHAFKNIPSMVIMITVKIDIHIWHVCLVMTKVELILVMVYN